jgi:putative transposase
MHRLRLVESPQRRFNEAMAYRRIPFVVGEWYHCYSRGIDKRVVFDDHGDYRRFIGALYLCNDLQSIHRENYRDDIGSELFSIHRSAPLVSIGAYCLLPNHFHILIKQNREGGISKFMQKVGTAYTMYYNTKNQRIGSLFVKPFRAKHVGEDMYFKRVAQYIHLNPAELFESRWKEGKAGDLSSLAQKITEYAYSSYPDFIKIPRAQRSILDDAAIDLICDGMPPLEHVLSESQEYYLSLQR